MSKATSTLCAALLAFACAAATPAYAITFATGQGTDSATCGAVTTPCRTLQQAVTNAPGGGYVVLKGPADFGPAEVQKSLSIFGENGATIRVPLGMNGIFVYQDPNAVVRLRGLTIEGGGVGGTGVVAFKSKRLEIVDCVIRNFNPIGAQISSDNFSILNTTVSGARWHGVRIGSPFGSTNGELDGLRLFNNDLSVEYDQGWQPKVVAKNTISSGNNSESYKAGFTGGVEGSLLILKNSASSGNGFGLDGHRIWTRGSTITGNQSAAKTSFSTITSLGGNVIRGNADDTLNLFQSQPLH